MNWDLFSFFLNNEEKMLALNSDIFETNVINIAILVGLLIYAYKTNFSVGLADRQKKIIQTIENAQKDVLITSEAYYVAEVAFTQSLFCLQSWKTFYKKEKIHAIQNKYKPIKMGTFDTYVIVNDLMWNSVNKAMASIQRYVLLMTAGRILRSFLALSPEEQSKFIEVILKKLRGSSL